MFPNKQIGLTGSDCYSAALPRAHGCDRDRAFTRRYKIRNSELLKWA